MKDLRQRVAELERKLAEVLTLVSNNYGGPQKILAPPMINFGASSAGIKKICKPLATGASFYKLGDKVHCGTHNTPLPRFTIANYNFSPYNGTYSCDVCRKNGGMTLSSSAFHCATCTMDICYECSNNPNTYQ